MALLLSSTTLLGGCGLFFGGQEEEATQPPARVLVPTFTPTPADQAAAQAADAAEAAEVVQPVVEPQATVEVVAEPAATPVPEEEPTDTPVPQAKLVITADIVNVRQGPGTAYGLVGNVSQGTELDIIARNTEGDWWQVCCVNGQQGWVFAQLAQAQNAEAVAVAADIPPTLPPPPTQPPAPAATDTPAPPPPPQGDADAGPCGGDDGCKFKVRGGPATGGNGGLELKLQFAFVHAGRGDEAQGSYFVVLKKDGVRLPVPDSVRSWTGDKTPGPLGAFNYEFSLGSSSLPGGTVAGNYVVWVLDGNGERDSEPFSFNIGDGQQGLLWIKFDQG